MNFTEHIRLLYIFWIPSLLRSSPLLSCPKTFWQTFIDPKPATLWTNPFRSGSTASALNVTPSPCLPQSWFITPSAPYRRVKLNRDQARACFCIVLQWPSRFAHFLHLIRILRSSLAAKRRKSTKNYQSLGSCKERWLSLYLSNFVLTRVRSACTSRSHLTVEAPFPLVAYPRFVATVIVVDKALLPVPHLFLVSATQKRFIPTTRNLPMQFQRVFHKREKR